MTFHDAFMTVPGTIELDCGPLPSRSAGRGRPSAFSAVAPSPFSNDAGDHILEGVLELEGILCSGGGPSRAGSRLTVTLTPRMASGQQSPSGKPLTPSRAATSSLSKSASGIFTYPSQSYGDGNDGASGRVTAAGGPTTPTSPAWHNQPSHSDVPAASPRGQHAHNSTRDATCTSVMIGIRPSDPSAIPAAPSPSQSRSLRPPSRASSCLTPLATAPNTTNNSSPNTPRGQHASSSSTPTGATSASPAGPASPRPLVSTPSFSGPAIRTSGGSKVSPLSSPLGRAPGTGLFARMSSGLNRSTSGWVEEGGLQRRPSGMAWSASGACPPDNEASSSGCPGDASPVTPIGLHAASPGFSRRLEDLPAAPSPAHARSLQSPARSPAPYGSPRTAGEVDASREIRRSLDSPRGAGTPRPPQHSSSSSGAVGVLRSEQQQQQLGMVVVAAVSGPEHVVGLPSPRRLTIGSGAGADGGRGDVLVRSGSRSRLGLEEGGRATGGGRGGGATGAAGSRVWGGGGLGSSVVGYVADADDGIDVVEVL